MVVVNVGDASGLQFGKLHEEVEASTFLLHELFVTARVKDLTLKRDTADHEAVENLNGKAFPCEMEAVIVFTCFEKVIVVKGSMNLSVRICVDLPQPNDLSRNRV